MVQESNAKINVGIATDDQMGTHFAVMMFPDGRSFEAPRRTTMAEALADMDRLRAVVKRTLGDLFVKETNPDGTPYTRPTL